MRHARSLRNTAAAGVTVALTLGGAAGCTAGRATPPAVSARALASPACSAAAAAGPPLGSAGTASLSTGGQPFGVAATPDGRWAFDVNVRSVTVLRLASGLASASGPAVTLARVVPLPASTQGAGAAVTPDGKYLLVAGDGSGLVVVSVARAEAGSADAVLGTLTVPSRGGGGAIEVTVSPDSRFAFVTLEGAGQAAVFNLAKAAASGFGPAAYVGAIPLGEAPVGVTVAPGGQWLYATSEGASPAQHPEGLSPASSRCTGQVPGAGPGEAPGTLTVVSLAKAETDPAHSVTATVDAGYQPVRVITAAGGAQVWVTARASDDLLCFSAARLTADPARALVAVVRVGSEPVGLAAVRGGALVVVADSNRFGAAGAAPALSVVSVAAALAGRPALTGNLAAGRFPRDMALSPGGTLLVSDFGSGQVQAIAAAGLPETL